MLSEFVEEDGHLSNVKEDVVLARIRYIGSKVLTYYTVPVGRIFFIEKGFNVFRDFFFSLFLINCSVYLLLYIVFHVLVHFADYPSDISFCHFLNINYFLTKFT